MRLILLYNIITFNKSDEPPMATEAKFPEFINTYQRVLISDYPTIAKLLYKHSCFLKDGGYNEEEFNADPTNVLSEKQIQDAIQGPYSAFFLSKIQVFTIIARLRMAAHIEKEDSLKDNLTTLEKDFEIDPKKLEDFPSDEVTKLQEQFDELVTSQYQQWEGQLFFWQMSLTGAMRESGVAVTEMEADEFAAAEPITEILDHYKDLNLEPPKVSYPLSFADYFRLKAYIAIHSALSRMMQPHTPKDIEKHMKALKKTLQEVEQKEKELAAAQNAETDEFLKPLAFVKLKVKK
jgi:hypothetical protein